MRLAVDPHEDLISMPPPTAVSQRFDPTFLDMAGKLRTEPVPPKLNRLMADIDTALVQLVFHIPQRQRKTDLHHHRKADDLRRRIQIFEPVWLAHGAKISPALNSVKLV